MISTRIRIRQIKAKHNTLKVKHEVELHTKELLKQNKFLKEEVERVGSQNKDLKRKMAEALQKIKI